MVRVEGQIVVGREPVGSPSWVVDDGAVSRNHFSVALDRGRWRVDDLRSSNGTFVNGRQVQSTWVSPQDVVRAGNSLFVLTAHPPTDLRKFRQYHVIGLSHCMAQLLAELQLAARDQGNVLLLGETGTGKDLLAHALHLLSGRRGRFLAVNCAAVPETLMESTLFGNVRGAYTGAETAQSGVFAEAHGGTVLLDEIGEVPVRLQVKLLRAVEEHRVVPVGGANEVAVDVKILAATNNFEALKDSQSGFRSDLLGRLEDHVLLIPPLRSRREDILALAAWGLDSEQQDAGEFHVSLQLAEELLLHPWPRNVRQLIKAVRTARRNPGVPLRTVEEMAERAIAISNQRIPEHDVPVQPVSAEATGQPQAPGTPDVPPTPEPVIVNQGGESPTELSWLFGLNVRLRRTGPPPREEFLALHAEVGGNVSAMARHYNCDRRQIYRWLDHFGLRTPAGESEDR
jgi:transcriptional regulator with GAF, ATPase, and Fis domain